MGCNRRYKMHFYSKIILGFFSLCMPFWCSAAAQDDVSVNCMKPKPIASSKTSSSGGNFSFIQTIESCGKNTPSINSQNLELIEKSAKYALDGAAESSKKSAEYAEKTLDTIKIIVGLLGGFLTILVAIAAIFGWKSMQDLKTEILKLSRRHISAARIRFNNQTEKAAVDFSERAKEEFEKFENLKDDFLKKQEDAVHTSNFFLAFTVAKNESLQCEHPWLKREFMGSALYNYKILIKTVDQLNKNMLKDFIEKIYMRKEEWDKEITDDAIFMKCWLSQDIAYLQKRLGDINGAIQTCQETLRVSPQAWSLVYNLACYLALENRSQEAIEQIEKCLASPYARKFAGWINEELDLAELLSKNENIRERINKILA